eukprot:m.261849 g.261849  ORF g.261849 m.261849 type:complete len:142 (+) comp19225_c1_seq35:5134-5559(+)
MDTASIQRQIRIQRSAYEDMQRLAGTVSLQATFNLAYSLSRSDVREDIKEALQLFTELRRRDPSDITFIYYLAETNFKLQEFQHARKLCLEVLRVEPNHRQTLQLQREIERTLEREGKLGMAIIGGVAVVAAATVAWLARK